MKSPMTFVDLMSHSGDPNPTTLVAGVKYTLVSKGEGDTAYRHVVFRHESDFYYTCRLRYMESVITVDFEKSKWGLLTVGWIAPVRNGRTCNGNLIDNTRYGRTDDIT